MNEKILNTGIYDRLLPRPLCQILAPSAPTWRLELPSEKWEALTNIPRHLAWHDLQSGLARSRLYVTCFVAEKPEKSNFNCCIFWVLFLIVTVTEHFSLAVTER
jgi:hypothetical protein